MHADLSRALLSVWYCCSSKASSRTRTCSPTRSFLWMRLEFSTARLQRPSSILSPEASGPWQSLKNVVRSSVAMFLIETRDEMGSKRGAGEGRGGWVLATRMGPWVVRRLVQCQAGQVPEPIADWQSAL